MPKAAPGVLITRRSSWRTTVSKQELIDETIAFLRLTDATTVLLMETADKFRSLADRIDAHLAKHTPVLAPEQKREAKQLAFAFMVSNPE